MKPWLYNLHLVIAIGGGSIGALTITQPLFQAERLTPVLLLLLFLFFAMYAFGVAAGLVMARHPTRLRYLKIYYVFQIPFVDTPLFSYRFTSGADITVKVHWVGVGFDFHAGSIWNISFLQSNALAIGINLMAVALLASLVRGVARPSDPNSPADTGAPRPPTEQPLG